VRTKNIFNINSWACRRTADGFAELSAIIQARELAAFEKPIRLKRNSGSRRVQRLVHFPFRANIPGCAHAATAFLVGEDAAAPFFPDQTPGHEYELQPMAV